MAQAQQRSPGREGQDEMFVSDSGYPVNDWGRPAGRDHHYAVPVDDPAARIAVLADGHRTLQIGGNCDCTAGLGEICIQTRDAKGHIPGLGQYSKSKRWESPFGPGRLEDLELRSANGGGTRIRGTVPAFDEHGHEFRLPVDFSVPETPMEVKSDLEIVRSALEWAEREAHEKRREQLAEAREECPHDHVVTSSGASSDAYCEDCPAAWHDKQDVPDTATLVGHRD